MKKILLLFYFFRVCWFESEEDFIVEIQGEDYTNYEVNSINNELYRSVKQYYCRAASEQSQQTLLYGTKAWMFPEQNVNLTLQYPSEYDSNTEGYDAYILTELKVILFFEGTNSRGYIVEGGMLQNHIKMTFIISNTTRLTYQFWLFGVRVLNPSVTEGYNAIYSLC